MVISGTECVLEFLGGTDKRQRAAQDIEVAYVPTLCAGVGRGPWDLPHYPANNCLTFEIMRLESFQDKLKQD